MSAAELRAYHLRYRDPPGKIDTKMIRRLRSLGAIPAVVAPIHAHYHAPADEYSAYIYASGDLPGFKTSKLVQYGVRSPLRHSNLAPGTYGGYAIPIPPRGFRPPTEWRAKLGFYKSYGRTPIVPDEPTLDFGKQLLLVHSRGGNTRVE